MKKSLLFTSALILFMSINTVNASGTKIVNSTEVVTGNLGTLTDEMDDIIINGTDDVKTELTVTGDIYSTNVHINNNSEVNMNGINNNIDNIFLAEEDSILNIDSDNLYTSSKIKNIKGSGKVNVDIKNFYIDSIGTEDNYLNDLTFTYESAYIKGKEDYYINNLNINNDTDDDEGKFIALSSVSGYQTNYYINNIYTKDANKQSMFFYSHTNMTVEGDVASNEKNLKSLRLQNNSHLEVKGDLFVNKMIEVSQNSSLKVNENFNSSNLQALQLLGYTPEEKVILGVKIKSDTEYSKISMINSDDSFFYIENAILDIDVIGNKNTISSDKEFTIIDASSLAPEDIFSFDIEVRDNSDLFDFEKVIVEGNNKLVVKSNYIGGSSFESNGTYTDSMSNVLNSVLDKGQADKTLTNISEKIAGMSTKEEKSSALRGLAPQVNGASQRTVAEGISKVTEKVTNRMTSLSSEDGLNNSENIALEPNQTLWGDFLYGNINQDKRKGYDGYDSNYYGFIFGGDREYGNGTYGLALAYVNSKVDGKGDISGNNLDIDTYSLTGYGKYDLENDYTLMGQLVYGFSNYDSNRDASGTLITGEYDSNSIEAEIEGVKDFQVGETTFTPMIGLNYLYLHTNSYTESAGGLSVEGEDYNSFSSNLGLEVKKVVSTAKSTFSPMARVNWNHEFINDSFDTTARFIGTEPAFTTQGLKPARDTLSLGLGVEADISNSWNLSVNYDLDLKEKYIGQRANLRVIKEF